MTRCSTLIVYLVTTIFSKNQPMTNDMTSDECRGVTHDDIPAIGTTGDRLSGKCVGVF
jgi:hypothetical protein